MFCSCSKSWSKMCYPEKDLMCSTLSQSYSHIFFGTYFLLCQSITRLFFFLKTLLLRVNLAPGIISSPYIFFDVHCSSAEKYLGATWSGKSRCGVGEIGVCNLLGSVNLKKQDSCQKELLVATGLKSKIRAYQRV